MTIAFERVTSRNSIRIAIFGLSSLMICPLPRIVEEKLAFIGLFVVDAIIRDDTSRRQILSENEQNMYNKTKKEAEKEVT